MLDGRWITIKGAKRGLPVFTVALSLALLINFVLIFLRVEIASYTGDEPNYTVSWDKVRYPYAAFYTDELSYYNSRIDSPLLYEIGNRLSFMIQKKIPVNINLYVYYVHFLKSTLNLSWTGVLFFTGLLYNVVFVVFLSYILTNILELEDRKSLFLLLFIITSPPYLQLISSWLRDLLIFDLVLGAFIAAKQRKVFSWVVITLLLLSIRAYMVPISVFILFYFYPRRKHISNSNIFKLNLISIIFIGTILTIILSAEGHERFVGEFPQRFVENFTGLTLWLVTGKIILRNGVYNFLSNIEMLSAYFYPFFYCILYIWPYLYGSFLQRQNLLRSRKCISLPSLLSGYTLLYCIPRILASS